MIFKNDLIILLMHTSAFVFIQSQNLYIFYIKKQGPTSTIYYILGLQYFKKIKQ